MTVLRRFRAVTAACLLSLCLSSTAFAADAQGFVRDKQVELSNLIKKSKGAADERKIDQAFDEVLDYDTLAKESLRDYWAERTPEQRAEFQGILKQLVRNAYRKNLKKTLGYSVEYKGESEANGGKLVRTVAKSRTNAREEPVSIDYLVREEGGKLRIADIVTEGSSLVSNYRNQFRRIIKKHGFEELLRRMRSKLEKGEVD